MMTLFAAVRILGLGGGSSSGTESTAGGDTASPLGNSGIFGGHSGNENTFSDVVASACACELQTGAAGYTQDIFMHNGYMEKACFGDYCGLPMADEGRSCLPMGDAHKLVAGYPDYRLNSHYLVTPANTFACAITLQDADEVLNAYSQVSADLGSCGDLMSVGGGQSQETLQALTDAAVKYAESNREKVRRALTVFVCATSPTFISCYCLAAIRLLLAPVSGAAANSCWMCSARSFVEVPAIAMPTARSRPYRGTSSYAHRF